MKYGHWFGTTDFHCSGWQISIYELQRLVRDERSILLGSDNELEELTYERELSERVGGVPGGAGAFAGRGDWVAAGYGSCGCGAAKAAGGRTGAGGLCFRWAGCGWEASEGEAVGVVCAG